MESIKFKNKFRIIAPTGEVVRLNTTTTINGNAMFIEGFDTLNEAQSARTAYCYGLGGDPEAYVIESYSDQVAQVVKQRLSPAANNVIARMKVFSGKGLKHNTIIAPREENKYNAAKYYSREVWLAQSAERSKGKTILPRTAKDRQTYVVDSSQMFNKLHDASEFNLSNSLTAQLKRKKFANRKELKLYLKSRGFTVRQINDLIPRVYA